MSANLHELAQARTGLTRRQLLRAAAAFPLTLALPKAFGQSSDFWSEPRELWLYRWDQRTRTSEMVREVYWYNGQLNTDGYVRICEILRDTHIDKAVQMDMTLLDILRATQGWLAGFGIPRPLHVNSGYRTPETNSHTEGAKQNSQHLLGRAADIHIAGVSSEAVSRFGLWLGGGGVGFYQASDFTHLDSGPREMNGRLRFWRG